MQLSPLSGDILRTAAAGVGMAASMFALTFWLFREKVRAFVRGCFVVELKAGEDRELRIARLEAASAAFKERQLAAEAAHTAAVNEMSSNLKELTRATQSLAVIVADIQGQMRAAGRSRS